MINLVFTAQQIETIALESPTFLKHIIGLIIPNKRFEIIHGVLNFGETHKISAIKAIRENYTLSEIQHAFPEIDAEGLDERVGLSTAKQLVVGIFDHTIK